MNELNDGKEIYNNIKIPKELDQLVWNTINKYPAQNPTLTEYSRTFKTANMIKYLATAAAIFLILFTAALNTSEAFAKAALKVPVIKQIAMVLTVRSYHISEGNADMTVKVPEIDLTENGNQQAADSNQSGSVQDTAIQEQFVADYNTEISEIVDRYLEDAKLRCAADKEAFLATGGTEEEWATRDLDITVDYNLKYEQDNLLSLILVANESWYGAYDQKYYYNLNLEENKELNLQDLLGEDYADIANSSIISQMKERTAQDPKDIYWGVTDTESGIPGFTSVDENTKFYLNEEGRPVICFAKYEIAPGFMGDQEFVIE